MKIAFVTSNYPPNGQGGTEQVVAALARELRQLGVSIAAVTCSNELHHGVDAHDYHHDEVPVRRLWKQHGEWDHDGFVRPRVLGLVREWLLQVQPDVAHVHSFAAFGAGTVTLCREMGIPVLLSFHDLWVTCARYFRLPPAGITCPTGVDRLACAACIDQVLHSGESVVAQALAQRDALVRADVQNAAVTVAPSQTAARFVRECLPFAGRIEVIPHGLLAPVHHRAAACQVGETLRVGMFGNLVAEKGVYELIQAMAGCAAELHLYGPWLQTEFRTAMRDLAQQLGVRLHEHGAYHAELDHPARHLHLAVFPSRCQETYGLVVDEALGHGVPVLLSDRGAFAERQGAGGVLVTALPALGTTLRALLADRAQLARLAAAVPLRLPTIKASAARHLALYQEIA